MFPERLRFLVGTVEQILNNWRDSPVFRPMIQVEHVGKQFQGKRNVCALDDVHFTIAKGEMVSVVGPSGSGKSTLLNLVGGLDRPTSGQVSVDGRPLAGLSDDELTRVRRDKIGFVFQFFNLLPALTCVENVALPLHLRGWRRREAQSRARELLTLVQLGARLRSSAGRALGRRATARRHRPGAVRLPARHPGRRADRESRHAHRRRDSRAVS